ncbi:MAG: NTP transferase domain-containing protein [Prevotella sp.]|nr:NTP transferase domain-containing protein [Prevotella sp.]
MKYAIIAAGEGSRLAHEGVQMPKPLVTIHGETLLQRLIRIFMDNQAEEICVICNGQTESVAQHLEEIMHKGLGGIPVPLKMLVKTTPSSMHSLYELSRFFDDDVFCATTVDTLFREREFAEYIFMLDKAVRNGEADGLMGVTSYIDDEKPLYVNTADDLSVTGFYDEPMPGVRYVSAGIYGLHRRAIDTLKACVARGEMRMRNFQRALLTVGLSLKAFPFSKVIDIDHASDIVKAETFLDRQVDDKQSQTVNSSND